MDECDEDKFSEYNEDNIHCVKAELEQSDLTQNDYEEALINEQVNKVSDDNGVFQIDEKNKYNLRSKTAAKHSAPPPPKKTVVPIKQQSQKEQVSKD